MNSRVFRFGDLHGDSNSEYQFLNKTNFPEQKELTKNDVFIQLGDFGYVWYYPKSLEGYKKDIHKLNEIADKNFTTLVIPGNHENYDIINALPIIEKWGGKVYELKLKSNSIFFAVRGEIYTINNKKFFTFSGATTSSKENRFSFQEYESGERVKKKKFRYGELKKVVFEKVKLKEISFWPQELSTLNERVNALDNLKRNDFKVDYILTHTPPNFVVQEILTKTELNKGKFTCSTALFLDKVANQTNFKEWFYGHLHFNEIYEKDGKKYFCHYKKAPTEIIM